MCQAISGEAVLAGDTVNVLTSDKTDSHTAIRAEHNIPEDSGGPSVIKHTPIELIPVTSLTELSGMEFRFDDKRPNWWTDDMIEEATRQLFQASAFTLKGRRGGKNEYRETQGEGTRL